MNEQTLNLPAEGFGRCDCCGEVDELFIDHLDRSLPAYCRHCIRAAVPPEPASACVEVEP